MDTIHRAIDTAANTLDALGNLLAAHEREAQIVTLGMVVLCSVVLVRVKALTFWVILGQHDRTDVGISMKWQKLSEAVMFVVWAAIFGLALWAVFDAEQFGVWERLWLRLVLIASMVAAALFGERFLWALQSENWGQPDREAAMDARDVRQDQRDDRQQRREDRWDAR